VADLRGVAAGAQCGQGGGLGAVEQFLIESRDVEVKIQGEAVSVPVGVQGLAAAEREPDRRWPPG
jgi:hypothetical protein